MVGIGSRSVLCVLTGIVTAAFTAVSRADYVFHDLYPLTGADATPSISAQQTAVGGQVIGQDNTAMHAVLWEGPGAPTLLPDSAYGASFARGIGGGQVVGAAYPDLQHSFAHAIVWTGPSHALIDLHPAGITSSQAIGTSGGEQVGVADDHAFLWHNTAASAVDLHPAGFASSQAFGTDGVHQVGIAFGSSAHALLWTGTAASVVDLGPGSAVGVAGDEQVGNGLVSGTLHALLWHGTAASVTDLHPAFAGTDGSVALATNGSQEVGFLQQPGNPFSGRAVLWSGSAASAVDLQALLPAGFTESWANSIDANGNVFGIAANDPEGAFHAVEWSPVPEPSSLGLAALVVRQPWHVGCGA